MLRLITTVAQVSDFPKLSYGGLPLLRPVQSSEALLHKGTGDEHVPPPRASNAKNVPKLLSRDGKKPLLPPILTVTKED